MPIRPATRLGLTSIFATLLVACVPFSDNNAGHSSLCFDGATTDVEGYESLDQLAWFSHAIVVGRVSEPLGSRRDPGNQAYFVTDYTIAVEQWLRGDSNESRQVLLRVYGGELDGCVQRHQEWPPFEPGDRGIFFLRDYEESKPPRYDPFGWWQGFWHIDQNDRVTTTMPHLRPRQYPTPLDQFVALVRTELENGPPPPDYLTRQYLVLLDESPFQ